MNDQELSAPSHAESHGSTRPYWLTMVALMLLLATTVAAAEIDFGALNLPIALTIATGKAALILYIFMHLRGSKPLIWLFAFSGIFWLTVLMTLTFSDYLTR